MRQPKLILTIAGLGMVLALSLTACGREEPEPELASLPPLELRMVADSDQADLNDQLFEKFTELHPNLTIKTENWGRWPRQYMTDPEPPDLMAAGTGDWLFSTIKEGLVTDVSDIWEQSGLSANYPESLQKLTVFNGKQYMLPLAYEWRGIYYNSAIFAQYGLEPPESWDQLMQIADTLQLNGEIPFAIAGRAEWQASLWFDYLNMRLNGPEFHQSLIAGEVAFTDDRIKDVLYTWQFMFDQDLFTRSTSFSGMESIMAVVRLDKDSPLTREKAVMVLTGPSDLDEVPMLFQNELDFFPFPDINPEIARGEIIGSFGYVIPANSVNRLEAMKYLQFISLPEIQELITQNAGGEASFIPAHVGAAANAVDDEIVQGLAIVQAAAVTSLPFMWASPSQMRTKMDSAIGQFLRAVDRGELDVDKVVGLLEEERLKLLGEGAFEN